MGPALLAPDDERMPLVWPEKAAAGGLRGSRSRPPAALASLVRGARAPDVGVSIEFALLAKTSDGMDTPLPTPT